MRSHYCGQVNEQLAGQEVTVAGWVHRRRDHGGVIFVDLRDREGLLQIVFDPDNQQLFANAERLRGEFVIQVRGLVRARPGGTARNLPPQDRAAGSRATVRTVRTAPFRLGAGQRGLRCAIVTSPAGGVESPSAPRPRVRAHAITCKITASRMRRRCPERRRGARYYFGRAEHGKFLCAAAFTPDFQGLCSWSRLDRISIVPLPREDLRPDTPPSSRSSRRRTRSSIITISGLMKDLSATWFRGLVVSLPDPRRA